MHEACNHNSLDVASRLLKAGACVNAGGLDNETPLHDAVNNGYVAVGICILGDIGSFVCLPLPSRLSYKYVYFFLNKVFQFFCFDDI